eukprot:289239-Pyramimonas_sp.AAC.1
MNVQTAALRPQHAEEQRWYGGPSHGVSPTQYTFTKDLPRQLNGPDILQVFQRSGDLRQSADTRS